MAAAPRTTCSLPLKGSIDEVEPVPPRTGFDPGVGLPAPEPTSVLAREGGGGPGGGTPIVPSTSAATAPVKEDLASVSRTPPRRALARGRAAGVEPTGTDKDGVNEAPSAILPMTTACQTHICITMLTDENPPVQGLPGTNDTDRG